MAARGAGAAARDASDNLEEMQRRLDEQQAHSEKNSQ
jgi:hypothetical protein